DTKHQGTDIQDARQAPEPTDFQGPSGFGFINFNQDDTGVLRLTIAVKGGSPNTTYTVFLVCGPTHDLSCGFIPIGSVTKNGVGNGNTTIHIDVATLQSLQGSGAATDHVDMIGTDGSVLVAGGINFTIP